ncbi:MAG: hypothetical protein V1660_03950 [archaeon]
MKMTRKAQEEILGFVLIILVVGIISLVFLGLALQKPPKTNQDKQVENLVNSMLAYTTNCALYVPQYETVSDLIKSCYAKDYCSDGRDTCTELKSVMASMIQTSIGSLTVDRPVKSYEFNISYSEKQSGGMTSRKPDASILYLRNGVSSGTSIGSQQFLPLDEGNIAISLKLWY